MASRRSKAPQTAQPKPPAPDAAAKTEASNGGYQLPEYLRSSRVLKRRRISKKDLPNFKEQMLLLHAPEALRSAFQSLCIMAQKEDLGAIRLLFEIFGYIEKKSGITVTQQILNAQMASSDPGAGFDQFVRSVHEARNGAPLLNPVGAPSLLAASIGQGATAEEKNE